MKTHKI